MDGWYEPVKLASPIIASTVDVGTPLVQFELVDHAVDVIPFQEVEVAVQNVIFKNKPEIKSK